MQAVQNTRLINEKEFLEENKDKIPWNVKYKVDETLRCYTIQVMGLPDTNLEGNSIIYS